MKSSEFDKFASEYAETMRAGLGAAGDPVEFYARYKVEDVARLLSRRSGSVQESVGLPFCKVLDFGAGVGGSVRHFKRLLPGAGVVCADVSMLSLRMGRSGHAEDAGFVCFDGQTLPFADNSFDVVFAACVFHHIPISEHRNLFAEFRRVLTTDGVLVVFEHNPLNPMTRQVVDRCPFDENAVLIRAATMRRLLTASGFSCDVAYRLFFPYALRWLRPVERLLWWLPIGAQYYVAATKA